MALLVVIVLFVGVAVLIAGFGYKHYVRPGRLLDQLKTTASDALPVQIGVPDGGNKQKSTVAGLLKSLGELVPVSPQDAALAKTDLIAAGFRTSSAVPVYYGTKFFVAAGMVLFALSVRGHIKKPLMRVILPIGAAAGGYALPAFGLRRIANKRKEGIRYGLPDALDMMVICTEAGCGLDQAIVNVSRDMKTVHPGIAEELGLVNMEIMAGKSRAEALRNLARRTDEEEMKKLVAILIQTDKFGTSVAEALRTQSDFLRVRRRQEAEERAGKVGVKLVFPIFFFCLPSLIVVTAGPGILQLFTGLIPIMKTAGH